MKKNILYLSIMLFLFPSVLNAFISIGNKSIGEGYKNPYENALFQGSEELYHSDEARTKTGFNESFTLHQDPDIFKDSTISLSAYPNPFSTFINFKFSLKENTKVNLEIYNILGRKVKTLHNSILEPGDYHFRFDGSALSNGVYFYSFKLDDETETGRIVLRK